MTTIYEEPYRALARAVIEHAWRDLRDPGSRAEAAHFLKVTLWNDRSPSHIWLELLGHSVVKEAVIRAVNAEIARARITWLPP